MRWMRGVSVIAVAMLALAACGDNGDNGEAGTDDVEPAAESDVTVAVVTAYYSSDATKQVVDEFADIGEARGWTVDVNDSAGDFDRLNSAMQDAVTRGVDAIVIGMGDPGQMARGLSAASDADIPVFAIDAAPAEGIVTNVTSDNADLGQQSAQWLIDEVGDGGRIIMFTHDPHPGVNARAEAAAALFDDAGIEIVQRIHVEVPGPVDDARSSMQDYLTANPGDDAVDGVWAGWDEPALGASQAIESAGRDGFTVVGVDGQDFAIAEIEGDGPFGATVKQDWDRIATEMADIVAAYLDGTEPDSEQIEIPGELLTR